MLNDTRRQIDNVINWRKSINEELNNSELLNERWHHGSYDAREIEKEGGFTRKNMRVHYVLFDGTSHYVTDEQDMLNLTKKDKDIEVVFKSMNFDIACDKADELNELL